MGLRRVVMTSIGALSPFGIGVARLWQGLKTGECGIRSMPNRETVREMGASVAAVVPDVDGKSIPRTYRRSMSRMGVFAYHAAMEAISTIDYPPEMGLAIGTTLGSPDTLEEFFREYLHHQSTSTVRSTTFFKCMGHGVASSLALALGVTGRTIAPSAACAAGTVAVGLGYEAIASGRQEVMLCGGTEEFNVLTAATFDQILAGSHCENPAAASRPFDINRDGVVCGEGCGLLLLESLDNARARGADIWAEIAGFSTNSSPSNLVYPDSESMKTCLVRCLADAGLAPTDVDAISAHATSTVEGDRAEARAIAAVFGAATPVVSLKGQLGHTMAASGSLELIAFLCMMRENLLLPNHNLEAVDPECGGICLPTKARNAPLRCILKNSFALGGVNASLLIKQYVE